MRVDSSGGRDLAISLVALLALAMPFLSFPGDHLTRMEVRFHGSGMAAPRAFTARTLRSVCTVMAAALAYDDPKTGRYTRIRCGP